MGPGETGRPALSQVANEGRRSKVDAWASVAARAPVHRRGRVRNGQSTRKSGARSAQARHLISESEEWRRQLRENPLPWLLDADTPAVRHLALRDLLGPAEPTIRRSRTPARRRWPADPIAAILAAQHPDGYWEKPGPGYATKYRGTVWQLIFLDQLGADPSRRADPGRLRAMSLPTARLDAAGSARPAASTTGHRRRPPSSTA